ncbi:hypothetical protein EJB05_04836, partial [Eragrostis curvula]
MSLHPKVVMGIDRNFISGGSMAMLDVHSREFTFSPEFKVLVNPVPDLTPTDGDLCYWRELPKPPFHREGVSCYGVCSDKNFIFVSISYNDSKEPATYTFNTAEMSSQWQLLGGWVLPFVGQVHFVSKLQVWVGLSLQGSG